MFGSAGWRGSDGAPGRIPLVMSDRGDPTGSLAGLVEVFTRGLGWAFVGSVIAATATFFLAGALPPTFEGEAVLIVSAQDPDQRDFGTTLVTAPALDVATYRSAILSRSVLSDAYGELDGLSDAAPSPALLESLAEDLSVRAEDARVSSVIRVVARATTAERASEFANAVANAAMRWDEQRATRGLETIIRSLTAQIASIDAELATSAADAPVEGLQRTRGDLQIELSSARALRSAAVGRLELLEEAVAPLEPVAPRPLRSAALAGLLAVFFVYGVLLLRDALDSRVRTVDELARVTDLKVLAEFPRVTTGRRTIPREATSHLRTAVGFATSEAHPKVILVSGAAAEQGKSTVSIALAESFARLDYRTVLVDADLRRPVIASEYPVPRLRITPLASLLKNPKKPVIPAHIKFDNRVELDVIPTFEPVADAAELLSRNIADLIERLGSVYDVIVIDSAPVLPVADSLTIAPHCSGVLLVASVPTAEKRSVVRAVELFRRIGVPILGVVATNLVRTRRELRGYGYGYGDATATADESPFVPHPTVGRPASTAAVSELG